MSFGVGIADIVEALQFARATYEAWRDAPEKYRAVKQRLRSLRGPLQQLATHFEALQQHRKQPRSLRSSNPNDHLESVLSSIQTTLDQLNRIIAKRSDLRFWDRLRLTGNEISDLSASLDRHVQDLTFLCGSLGLESGRQLYHSQQTLQRGQQDLQRGQDRLLRLVEQLLPARVPAATLEAVAESVDSLGASESLMMLTDHGDEDDPEVWRKFRRKALSEGVTSRELEAYQAQLHDLLRAVGREKRRGRQRERERDRVDVSFEVSTSRRSGSRRDKSLRRRPEPRSHFEAPLPRYFYRSASPQRGPREQRSAQGRLETWSEAEFLSIESSRGCFRRRRSFSVEAEMRKLSVEMGCWD
ncbi:hypothetical protein Q7P37_010594 [Cladosporium fusiforme]